MAVTLLLAIFLISPLPSFAKTSEDTSSQGEALRETSESQVHTSSLDSVDPGKEQISGYLRDYSAEKTLNSNSTSFSGAFVYDYPLSVPPGRNGMTPDLTLSNSNQSHAENDVFGYGWNISIPYIERENIQGTQNLYATSTARFYSSLSGELASTTASSTLYAARNDDGPDYKYSFANNKWIVTNKLGTTYIFGSTTAARQDDTANPGRVYKWMLEQTKDTNGNTVSYTYFKDAGQIYPSSIGYTGNATSTAPFSIDFTHSLRSAPAATTTSSGFPVQTRYHIDQISAKVNGSWVTKYDLDYTSGDNGKRLLLSSITQSGQNESEDVTALPATTFAYATSTEQWTDPEWTIPVSFVSDGDDPGYVLADVNGDGLTDIVGSTENADNDITKETYLANGSGWTLDPTWEIPCLITRYANSGTVEWDEGTRIVDVNGDLLPDVICNADVYLNNGHGWTLSGTWTNPEAITWSDRDAGTRFLDVNGDGLTDIVRGWIDNFNPTTPTIVRDVYINNGHGWTLTPSWNLPVLFSGRYKTDTEARIADVNADGLDDLISGDYSSTFGPLNTVYLNTGSGWATSTAWTLPVPAGEEQTRLADFNGDGLIDIGQASYNFPPIPYTPSWTTNNIYLNTGSGWVLDPSRKLPAPFIENTQDAGTRMGEFNGDGNLDFITYGAGTVSRDWAWRAINLSTGDSSDLIAHINEQNGAHITPVYQGSAAYRDDDDDALNPTLPLNLITVKQILTSDGNDGTTTDSYSYEGGSYYFNNPFDRRLAGFGAVTETDGEDNTTKTYFHQGNTSATSTGEYLDEQSKIGKPYRVEVRDSSGNLFEKIVNKWESFVRSVNQYFVKETRTTDFSYDGDSSHREKATTYVFNDANGNLQQQIEWGEVTGSDDGSFTDTGSDKFTTSFSYASSTGTSVIGRQSAASTTDQLGNKIKEVRDYYDSLSLGSISKGNLTKEENWIATSTYATTQHAYDSYGMVTQDTNPRGKITTYSYDPYHLYVATSTNPLLQKDRFTYDYSSGAVRKHTDANGLTFESVYDGVDRLIEEMIPDLTTPSTPVYKDTIEYDYDDGLPVVTKTAYLDGSVEVPTITYFDGRLRPVQERRQSETPGTYIVTDTAYDDRGQVGVKSLPYFSSGSSRTSMTGTTPLLQTYSYDALNRLTTFANAVGATFYDYNNWTATTTDPMGNARGFAKDAYGNLSQVTEANSGDMYVTKYAWDGLGDLTKVTDANGAIRNFTYDRLGRMLSAQDLHSSADTSYGTWAYTYDPAGNEIRSVSPRAKTVNYTYDDLNRLLTEDSADTGFTDAAYVYDTSDHYGIGKLASVSTGYIGTGYDYDANGNISAEQSVIPGSATTTMFHFYDRQANPTYLLYPDGAYVYYGYNAAGLPEYIQELENGALDWSTLVYNFDYSPLNQLTLTQYGNGTNMLNTYDDTSLYWLAARETWNATSYLQYLGYGYDYVGNPTVLLDYSYTDAAKRVDYTYDDLYRLTSAQSSDAANGQDFSRDYTYDPVGDMLTNSGTDYYYDGNTGTNYANPHAPTEVGGHTYTYDTDGNLLTNGTLTNTWNYKDQLTQSVAHIGTTTATSTYTYDQSGSRISQSAGGATTFYPNKYYSVSSSGVANKYLYVGDQLLATIQTSTTTTTHYSYPDPTGNTSVVADASGNQEQLLDYYPYGALRIDDSSTSFDEPRKYLGQYYDDRTDLSYLNARYYDGARGQFLSQDPVFWSTSQNLENPQSLNSYSYANNNPITNSDPTGLASNNSSTRAQQAAIQKQIDQLKGQVNTLWTNLTVNAPKAAAGGFIDPIGGYNTAANGSLPTSVRVGGGIGLAAGAVSVAKDAAVVGVKGLASLAARAGEVNGVLDAFAQSRRTAAVLQTSGGNVVAGGGVDLTRSQIGSLQPGEIAANAMRGAHAEVTAITHALSNGLTPQGLGSSRAICSSCQSFITSTGGQLMDAFTARW